MIISTINKKVLTISMAIALLFAALLPISANAAPGKSGAAMAAKPGNATIVEIVLADDGKFDVLQAAVVSAGLVDALNGTRQYTVFAPTDEAFVKTLGAANEAAAISAVQTMDKVALKNILLYHVTSGRHTSTSVLARNSYTMLNGSTLTKTKLANAGIAATDVSARNGIVHVINSVLLP